MIYFYTSDGTVVVDDIASRQNCEALGKNLMQDMGPSPEHYGKWTCRPVRKVIR